VRAVYLIPVAADWADIFVTPTKRENLSQSPLHTVSRKHELERAPGSGQVMFQVRVCKVEFGPISFEQSAQYLLR